MEWGRWGRWTEWDIWKRCTLLEGEFTNFLQNLPILCRIFRILQRRTIFGRQFPVSIFDGIFCKNVTSKGTILASSRRHSAREFCKFEGDNFAKRDDMPKTGNQFSRDWVRTKVGQLEESRSLCWTLTRARSTAQAAAPPLRPRARLLEALLKSPGWRVAWFGPELRCTVGSASSPYFDFWSFFSQSIKLCKARSLLCRRQNLQVNIRWKALDEIYKIYMLLHRSDPNIS